MPYIAHAAVKLHHNYAFYEQDVWNSMALSDGTHINWRLKSDKVLEVASNPIKEKCEAIELGKRLYPSLLIQLLKLGIPITDPGCDSYANRFYNEEMDGDRQEDMPECQLVWKKNYSGGGIGLDIYEADSFDELEHRACSIEFEIEQTSDADVLVNIDLSKVFFDFTPITQEYLATLCDAERVMDAGLRMTLYCGILEKLAGESDKDQDVIDEIDKLIGYVDCSSLSGEKKEGLKGLLRIGKKESAQKRIKGLCDQYARDMYGGHKTVKIIKEAYSLRSTFSHTGPNNEKYSAVAQLIKWITIDVLCGYFKDHPEEVAEKTK